MSIAKNFALVCGLGLLISGLAMPAHADPESEWVPFQAEREPDSTPITDLSAKTCVEALDLTHAQQLTLDSDGEGKAMLVIDSRSPCINTAGSKALYTVAVLPASDTPYAITVASIGQNDAFLAPHALFLTSAGTVSRDLPGDAFTFRKARLSALVRSRQNERYLVVESDPASVGKDFSRVAETVYSTYLGSATIYSGSDVQRNYVFAHSGAIMVSIAPIPKN